MLPRTAQAHTPLRTSKSRHTWCGPYAAAVFMRQHYDAAYEVCLCHTFRGKITGMSNKLMKTVMGANGIYMTLHYCRDVGSYARQNPTLAAWLKTRDRKKTYLVNITGHYIVVSGDKTIDNQSGEWHSVRKSKHRRKRVGYAWEIKAPR